MIRFLDADKAGANSFVVRLHICSPFYLSWAAGFRPKGDEFLLRLEGTTFLPTGPTSSRPRQARRSQRVPSHVPLTPLDSSLRLTCAALGVRHGDDEVAQMYMSLPRKPRNQRCRVDYLQAYEVERRRVLTGRFSLEGESLLLYLHEPGRLGAFVVPRRALAWSVNARFVPELFLTALRVLCVSSAAVAKTSWCHMTWLSIYHSRCLRTPSDSRSKSRPSGRCTGSRCERRGR